MRTHSLITTALIALFALGNQSCNKQKNDATVPSPSECRIAAWKDDKGQTLFTVAYTAGKPSRVVYYKLGQPENIDTYAYNGNKVTILETDTAGVQKDITIVTLNTNGYASKAIYIEYGNDYTSYDTTTFQYNNEGYLTYSKLVSTTEHDGVLISNIPTETTYTITEGNITSKTEQSGDNTSTYSYEYYSDKENKGGFYADAGPAVSLFFLGKTSRNLPKKATAEERATSFDYVLDENGYVTKEKITYASGDFAWSGSFNFEYLCQ